MAILLLRWVERKGWLVRRTKNWEHYCTHRASKEMNRNFRFDHFISMLIHPRPSRVNQIVSCRLIFQLWKLTSPVRDGCINCEYKWIIDVDIALLDSTTVLGFRSRTEAHAAEGRC